ncbi:hypothetical protein [Paenibacillus sp. BC26]|uniref:hypothetical protein n=1 Tax=Paenibacillus sp. BC26 TaxID=1881032 RepID=UPI0008E17004|nr:hypothetical protein [Paenibacillus sp. BC26]SFS76067.1 hypothetical protein SAMN05428962_2695 [Paenibacillus sp. BC26]
MNKILAVILCSTLIITSCSTTENIHNAEPIITNKHLTQDKPQTNEPKANSSDRTSQVNSENVDYDQEQIKERMKGKERKGQLKIENVKNHALSKSLFEAMNEYFIAMKEGNEDRIEKLLYPGTAFKGGVLAMYDNAIYTQAVTDVALDKERVKSVSGMYGLNCDNVAIVVVNLLNTDGVKLSGNFIFEKNEDNKWLIFKTD